MKPKFNLFIRQQSLRPNPCLAVTTVLALGSIAAFLLQSPARAADFTWDGGGGDGNWGTAANWNPDGAPTPSSTNNLIFAGTANLAPINNYTDGDDFKDITFASGAGAFTISNTGSNGIDWFGSITNNSTNTQTIGFRLYQSALGGNTISAVNGNIALNSSALLFRNGQALALTSASGKTIQIGSVIADGGGGAGSSIALNGAGTVTLAGSNTFSSGVTLSGGTLNIGNATALGTGTFTISGLGVTFDNTSGGALTIANNIQTGSNQQYNFTGTNDLQVNGTVTISGGTGIQFNTVTAGKKLTLNNTVAYSTFQMEKGGAGTLVLNAANTGTGATNTTHGDATVGGATLGYTFYQSGGGITEIGNAAAFGTGAVALQGGGTLQSNTALTGANKVTNQIVLSGNATIGGSNNIELGGTVTNAGGNQTLTINNSGTTTISGNVSLSGLTGTGRTLTVSNTTAATISGVIQNYGAGAGTAGSFTKSGTGTLTLSGTNTYTGITTISAGTLTATNTQALGTGANAATQVTLGTATLSLLNNGAGNNGTIIYGGATVSNNGYNVDRTTSGTGTFNVGNNGSNTGNTIQLGALATNQTNIFTNANGYNLTFAGNTTSTSAATFTNNMTSGTLNLGTFTDSATTGQTITFNGTSATAGTTVGAISQGTGAVTIVQSGSGTLTLSGANTYTGGTRANAGTTILSGSHTKAAGTGDFLSVNNVGAQNAVLKVTAGTQGFTDINIGEVTNSRAAVYQTGGDLSTGTTGGIGIKVGSGATSYGYYNLSGGTLTLAQALDFQVGGGSGATGVMDVSGGTVTTGGWIVLGRNGAGNGLLNVTGGSVTSNSNNIAVNWANTSGSTSILNVGGGAGAATVTGVSNAGNGLSLSESSTTGTVGVANLLTNGTITVGKVYGSQAASTALLNFNGGTLKATATNAGANFLNSANIDAVTVYSGGGTIDNNNTGITVSNVLGAATGSGVTSIAVASKGSGYIGAPLVTITGGTGNTATGYAVMEDDGTGNGTFRVASIVITSGGTYTVDPTTVTLTGGGATTAATIGTITTAANTSGGMTFGGAGTTTLTAANNYTGATTISAGTLQIGNGGTTGSLSASSAITDNATLTINRSNAVAQGTDFSSAAITGTGAFIHAGSGTTTLNVANTFSGSTTLTAGTLSVADTSYLGGATANNAIVFNGGTLQVTGTTMTSFGSHAVTYNASKTVGFDIGNAAHNFNAGSTAFATGSTDTLLKTGAGTLTLGAASNTLKAVQLNQGTLDIGSNNLTINNTGGTTINNATTNSVTINATGGGKIVLSQNNATDGPDIGAANGGTLTINAGITGTSSFESWGGTANGTGVTVLTGQNDYTGNTIINTGVLSVSNIGNTGSTTSNLGQSSTINISSVSAGNNQNSTLRYTGTGETTNRVINFFLNGNNTGGIIEQSGASGLLKFTSNQTSTGTGSKTLTLQGSTAGTGEFAGNIVNGSGTIAVTKAGTGTWTLSGANTYTGKTTVSGGTLQFAKTASLYNGATGSWTAANITAASGATLAMNVGGTGQFAATDVNTLLTNISVASSSTTGLQAGAKLGFDTTNATGGTFTLGNAIADSTGANGGAIGATKLGTGTLVFDKTNTYSGATTVSAGKLIVSGSIANSDVTVSGASTTLASGGTGTIGKNVTINNGAILAAGDINTSGTATVTTNTTFNDGSIFSWDISSDGATYDKLATLGLSDGDVAGGTVFRVVAADSTFANGFWNTTRTWGDIFTTDGSSAISNWASLFTTIQVYNSGGSSFTPVNGSFSVSGSTLTWNAVPEPSSPALVGLLVGAALLRRRRQ